MLLLQLHLERQNKLTSFFGLSDRDQKQLQHDNDELKKPSSCPIDSL